MAWLKLIRLLLRVVDAGTPGRGFDVRSLRRRFGVKELLRPGALRELLKTDIGTLLRGGKAPHEASAFRKKAWLGPRYLRAGAWRRHLLIITEQLAAIIRCNGPLVEGLEAAIADAPNQKLASVLLALRDDLSYGLALWEAMRRRPRFFPAPYVDLVKVGEETGNLYETLSELGESLLRGIRGFDFLKQWLAYLLATLWVQVGVLSFILSYVLPEFQVIFEDFGAEHTSGGLVALEVLLSLGSVLHAHRTALVLGFMVSVIGGKYFLKKWRHRGFFHHNVAIVFWGLPWLRTMFVKANLVHVARIIAPLLRAGVPLDDALDEAAHSHVHLLYASRLRRMRRRIRQGESLAEALKHHRWFFFFPKTFSSLVSVGESSGMLPEALDRLSSLYERELRKQAVVLSETLTPIGVLAMGCIVLTINYSMFSVMVHIADIFSVPL